VIAARFELDRFVVILAVVVLAALSLRAMVGGGRSARVNLASTVAAVAVLGTVVVSRFLVAL
jgi:hypothetical protein